MRCKNRGKEIVIEEILKEEKRGLGIKIENKFKENLEIPHERIRIYLSDTKLENKIKFGSPTLYYHISLLLLPNKKELESFKYPELVLQVNLDKWVEREVRHIGNIYRRFFKENKKGIKQRIELVSEKMFKEFLNLRKQFKTDKEVFAGLIFFVNKGTVYDTLVEVNTEELSKEFVKWFFGKEAKRLTTANKTVAEEFCYLMKHICLYLSDIVFTKFEEIKMV